MIARQIISDEMTDSTPKKEEQTSKGVNAKSDPQHWYSIPEPVRRVFEQFPLVTYNQNSIPQRARRRNDRHTLYVFANHFGVGAARNLSCNPTCLKWQVYLKFSDIEFAVIASNNHASPSGSLPFLLPASSTSVPHPPPLATTKFPRWVSQQTMEEEDSLSMEHEAYMALVDQSIRNAWLHYLYLTQANFDSVAFPLYVSAASSSSFVQKTIAYQLREAAQTELLKTRCIIDQSELYEAARKAFEALSTLLGSNKFFSADERPGLLDASIFAYTHLLLDDNLPWKDTTLTNIVQNNQRLVDHRRMIIDNYI